MNTGSQSEIVEASRHRAEVYIPIGSPLFAAKRHLQTSSNVGAVSEGYLKLRSSTLDNTYFGLLRIGEANIPLDRVAPEYFGLSFAEARRGRQRTSVQGIPLGWQSRRGSSCQEISPNRSMPPFRRRVSGTGRFAWPCAACCRRHDVPHILGFQVRVALELVPGSCSVNW